MDRRHFLQSSAFAGVGLYLSGLPGVRGPEVAITMDDFNWDSDSIKLNGAQRNQAILEALRAHSVKAALFVKGANAENEEGKRLLKAWDDEGHVIANHSYSHWYYHNAKITAQAFQQDILRCEQVLGSFSHYKKLFRFPYLKEGDSVAKRDAIRVFLRKHGYRNGHVTIDASDWAIDGRFRKRLTAEPQADVDPYRRFYLDHMWERSQYYEDLAQKVIGHSVRHTILVHFNLLNALFLGDLVKMFKDKGWRVIDAAEAFADPVFKVEPKVVPAGESLIWALAKETGRFDKLLRYPGEDAEYEMAKMDKLGL